MYETKYWEQKTNLSAKVFGKISYFLSYYREKNIKQA